MVLPFFVLLWWHHSCLMHVPIFIQMASLATGTIELYGQNNPVADHNQTEDGHDDIIKWSNFPRYWPFVRGTHRSPLNSPHKGQWRGAFMLSLICTWINGSVNNREAGDLIRIVKLFLKEKYHTWYSSERAARVSTCSGWTSCKPGSVPSGRVMEQLKSCRTISVWN